MRVAILTSSRADYSIYLPLLQKLRADPFFDLNIIAFGTHLSPAHGETISKIEEDGFIVNIKVDTMPEGDDAFAISRAIGKTVLNFSSVWKYNSYDLIFALGDRYEMFAACASAVPFGLKIAHIHGGETTLGAIDEIFRHAISHMSFLHFTSSSLYWERVVELKKSEKHVYNVGALSIDNLKQLDLLSLEAFKEYYNIDLSIPSILITFHPETVAFEKNEVYILELVNALKEIHDYQFVITMPNSDTMGNMIRRVLKSFIEQCPKAVGVESFGTLGYLSCMKHSAFMLGNTSSGFIEASFFSKYVINLGNRQDGRIVTPNINNCPIEKPAILRAVEDYLKYEASSSTNIYGDGFASTKIVSLLKSEFS